MKILYFDEKKNSIKLVPETSDDLWTLYTLIREGDVVKAKTVREVKFGDRGSGRSSRVPMKLTIRVTSVEFQAFTDRLRIRGRVIEGPERFGIKGKYHTISVTIGSELEIIKESGWTQKHLERLRKTPYAKKALLVALDYDEYAIAILENQGVRMLVEADLKLPGKNDPSREEILKKEIATIVKSIKESIEQGDFYAVFIAGPGFLKNDVAEKLRERIPIDKIKIYVDNVSMGGIRGIYELLRRDTVRKALQELSVIEAELFFEEFDKKLADNPEMVSYGLEDVSLAVEAGAVKKIIVLDELVHSFDENERRLVEKVLEEAEKKGAEIVFLNTKSDAGIRLKMLGGIAALHRFPVPTSRGENS